ncbi:MAG: DEAD/DEAH box helicase [Saccharospirillaceae bacterium]|nr:DEAD/DEAH box helicase [Pseudomonadales bacterium]NRB78679.1 DEAD/DEAH box helicase [Saccharospirillaceae bacterium]
MTFLSLLSNKKLLKAVADSGYTDPTPIQQQAIPAILAGSDIMAGAQTGTGKTAAFALPLLSKLDDNNYQIKKIRVLVLTPTRELAQQVYKSFEDYGNYTHIKMAIAYGGVSIKPQVKQINSGAEVLVATPGRLLDHIENGSVSLQDLQCLVFDEADRMLDMGFQAEINNILKHSPKKRQTLLFSATFDDAIIKLSKTLLNNPKMIEVSERNAAAAEVEQVIYTVDADRKRELTSHLIGKRNWRQVLIFTRTKQTADILAKEMCKDGIKAASIHGDKSQGARNKALAEFKEGKTRALVATDVAARGLDIVDLQYVINFELPHIAEDYIHRIGRTGRAGKTGLAISLMSPGEEWLLEAVEKVLDSKVPQESLAGYELDLTKKPNSNSFEIKKEDDSWSRKKKKYADNSKGRRPRR